MSLLLDALQRASKDKEKIAVSASPGDSPLLAPTLEQPLALVQPIAPKSDEKSPSLVPPATLPAAPDNELSLTVAPGLLSDLPPLEMEPAVPPLPPSTELSLEIQPAAELATEPPSTPAPEPVVAVKAPESQPVAAAPTAVVATQTVPTAAASNQSAAAASAVASPPLDASRAAKEIRRAYAEKSKSAGTGKRRTYVLASVALALTLTMGSFFLGLWGDPLTLLGLGGSSSLAPASPPSAAVVTPQPLPVALEPDKPPAESAREPVTPTQTVTASPALKAAAVAQRTVPPRPVTDAQATGNEPRRSTIQPTLSNSRSKEMVVRPSDGASAISVRPIEPSALEVAYMALVQGRMEESARAYEQALKINPQESDALLGLAYIAQQQGQNEAAQTYYHRVLRLDPGNMTASTALLGLESQRSNTLSSARVRELVAQQPQSAATLSVAGHVLVRDGLFQEAAQMFARAQGVEPLNPLHTYNLAVALDRSGQYAQAREKYRSLLKSEELSSSSARRVFSLEAVRLRLEQLNQALGNHEPSTP